MASSATNVFHIHIEINDLSGSKQAEILKHNSAMSNWVVQSYSCKEKTWSLWEFDNLRYVYNTVAALPGSLYTYWHVKLIMCDHFQS